MGDLILKRPWVAIGIIVIISSVSSTIINRPYIEYCARINVENKMDTIISGINGIGKKIDKKIEE